MFIVSLPIKPRHVSPPGPEQLPIASPLVIIMNKCGRVHLSNSS